MCAFWLEIVSVCVLWGENFLRAPPSADIYDIFTVPAFFDAPIGSMTGNQNAHTQMKDCHITTLMITTNVQFITI